MNDDKPITKEQSLLNYISFMSGASESEFSNKKKYLKDARGKLNILRENKSSDPDRYNALEKEKSDIIISLRDNKPKNDEEFNETYGRFIAIGKELTEELWEEVEDIFSDFF